MPSQRSRMPYPRRQRQRHVWLRLISLRFANRYFGYLLRQHVCFVAQGKALHRARRLVHHLEYLTRAVFPNRQNKALHHTRLLVLLPFYQHRYLCCR